MALGVCEGCRRFARGERCPFCGARVGAPLPIPGGRRNRLGKLAAGAAALALAGCGAQTHYGAPAFDSGPEDAPPIAADAAYGASPVDSGAKDAGSE
jgi:hypothetical protein